MMLKYLLVVQDDYVTASRRIPIQVLTGPDVEQGMSKLIT